MQTLGDWLREVSQKRSEIPISVRTCVNPKDDSPRESRQHKGHTACDSFSTKAVDEARARRWGRLVGQMGVERATAEPVRAPLGGLDLNRGGVCTRLATC